MIISASRRTDIPALYSAWLLNGLKNRSFIVANPYNKKQITKINFTPETLDCLVFWTKNPLPILDKLKSIDKLGYKYYFQFTLTPYDQQIEKNLPSKKVLLAAFKKLAFQTKVIWRYDPVIINKKFTPEFHQKSFAYLASELSMMTDTCIFSFLDLYAKLKKSGLEQIQTETKLQVAENFLQIANFYKIKLASCCEDQVLRNLNIAPTACIDKTVLENLNACSLKTKKHTSQRATCSCVQSIDIGAYNTCTNGCSYCYANHNQQIAWQNFKKHQPACPALIPLNSPPTKEKSLISLKEPNIRLFAK